MDVHELPVDAFLSATAAESVAPAGGTAAAVVGGVGASLCEMGCIHTLMDREATDSEELADGRNALADLRAQLLALGNADADLVAEMFGSGDADVGTDWKRAVGVPLATAEVCGDVLNLAPTILDHIDSAVVTDVKTGVLLAHGALRASLFVVRTNLPRVADESFVTDVDRRTTAIETAAAAALERALDGTEGTA